MNYISELIVKCVYIDWLTAAGNSTLKGRLLKVVCG